VKKRESDGEGVDKRREACVDEPETLAFLAPTAAVEETKIRHAKEYVGLVQLTLDPETVRLVYDLRKRVETKRNESVESWKSRARSRPRTNRVSLDENVRDRFILLDRSDRNSVSS